MNIAYLETCTLGRGSHPNGSGQCAREAIHYAIHGTLADKTPTCCSACLAALPILNNWKGWRDDAERTEFLRPWLARLARTTPAHDQQRAYALADYAVRVVTAEACERAGFTDHAARLRAITPIVDTTTAHAAAYAADAAYADAAHAAANAAAAAYAANAAAAYAALAASIAVAANAAAYAAADAAYAAADAAYAAADAADAANFRRHAAAILDIICQETNQ